MTRFIVAAVVTIVLSAAAVVAAWLAFGWPAGVVALVFGVVLNRYIGDRAQERYL
jgi:membrane protein implicated in regulation of membrane protease activity